MILRMLTVWFQINQYDLFLPTTKIVNVFIEYLVNLEEVDNKSAQLIMMNTKLQIEEKKVTRLTNILKALNIWQ